MSDDKRPEEEPTVTEPSAEPVAGDNTPQADPVSGIPGPEHGPEEASEEPVTPPPATHQAEPVSQPAESFPMPQTVPATNPNFGAPQVPPPPLHDPGSGDAQHHFAGATYGTPDPKGEQPKKPKTMETAFAFLFFLGFFGGHKFYLGQNTLGLIYLLAGLGTLSVLNIPLIGQIIGMFFIVVIFSNLYADIRTMREQLLLSEEGKDLTVDDQISLFKKAFQL